MKTRLTWTRATSRGVYLKTQEHSNQFLTEFMKKCVCWEHKYLVMGRHYSLLGKNLISNNLCMYVCVCACMCVQYGRDFQEGEVGGNEIDFFCDDADNQIDNIYGNESPSKRLYMYK